MNCVLNLEITIDLCYNGIKEVRVMMYPYLTLDDETEIVHSEKLEDGTVKVYVEKPDEKDGFHSAVCFLPGYSWTDVTGFSDEEISRYQRSSDY